MAKELSTNHNKSDVIIVGAGVPGCILALKLAKLGLRVAILERQKRVQLEDTKSLKNASNGRSVALMQRACAELEAFDIISDIDQEICPLKSLRIIDDSFYPKPDDRMISYQYEADEIGLDAFGYNIPLQRLLATCQDKLQKNQQIDFIDQCEIVEIDFDGEDRVAVKVKGKKNLYTAPLIIGADGRESIVRAQAGIAYKETNYPQTALTCVISHEREHDHISTEFHRPTGPFTLVPMKGKKSAIVWSESHDRAESFLKAGQDAVIEAIQERSRSVLGTIKVETPLFSWPLKHIFVKTPIAKRCALVAEAAHVLSPIGAQGLNLSLRDVEDLYDVIKRAALNGLDIGGMTTLKQYERTRKIDTISRGIGVDLFHRSVATDHKLIHKLRREGLKFFSEHSMLRHVLMQEGLSPARR